MTDPSKKMPLYEVYEVFVHGVPRPQPRPRMSNHGHVYTPKSADAWKTAVMTAFMIGRKPRIDFNAVYLEVDFYLPRPKYLSGRADTPPHISKPDLDNLLKSTMDALTQADIWRDDSLAVKTEVTKRYADDTPGAVIRISI